MADKQFIVFMLDGEKYAVDVNTIASINDCSSITKLPNGPEFVAGLLHLRGDIIPVISLKDRFKTNSSYGDDKRILISNIGGHSIGYLVDDASESMLVNDKDIKAIPQIVTRENNQYLDGVCIKDSMVVLIVNLLKVFSQHELEDIVEATNS